MVNDIKCSSDCLILDKSTFTNLNKVKCIFNSSRWLLSIAISEQLVKIVGQNFS